MPSLAEIELIDKYRPILLSIHNKSYLFEPIDAKELQLFFEVSRKLFDFYANAPAIFPVDEVCQIGAQAGLTRHTAIWNRFEQALGISTGRSGTHSDMLPATKEKIALSREQAL